MLACLHADPLVRQLESGDQSCDDSYQKPYKQINQYLLIQELGEGSIAKVYLAKNQETGNKFAVKRFKIKELQRIDAGLSQLERELSAMRKICHPNILKLYDVLHDTDHDVVYTVIDYADCGSLENYIEESLDLDQLKAIFLQILKALQYLHGKGIVHQDIKPSNILLCKNGKAYLSDFGVGHSFQSADMVVGSPAYQAPEALADIDVDPDSLDPAKEDIWSLGVTLYQLLFGYLPYTGDNVFEIIHNIRNKPLVMPVGTDPSIESILRSMLAVNPANRFSVENCLESDFFKDASSNVKFNLSPIVEPKIDSYNEITLVNATICDHTISFARPCLTSTSLIRSIQTGVGMLQQYNADVVMNHLLC